MTETDSEQDDAVPRTLAAKIGWLIEYKWPPGAQPPASNAKVAKAIADATGRRLDRSTVWKLRAGQNTNPKLKTLKALRDFFGVPTVGYFDDAEEAGLLHDLTALLSLLKDRGVDPATLRSLAELSPDGRAVISDLIGSLARRENRS